MDFFVPDISLHSESDGEFALSASTLVPTPCFRAGPASPGTPPSNIRLLPEVFPVQLYLVSLEMLCVQRPVLCVHRVPNLSLKGKKSVFAFVVLGNQLL